MPLLVAALAAFVLAAVPLAAQERPVSGPGAPRQSALVSGPDRPAAPAGAPGNGPASVTPGDRPGEADRASHPAAAATLPHDLSPWGMFLAADRVVKSVMVGLAFASMATWTIWLAKALELAAARARARRAVVCLERAASLGDALVGAERPRWPKRGPVAALAQAASQEVARSDGLGTDGVKDRAAVALQRIEARAGRAMSRGTGLLATIGSTAPFVGLFGTVWGIMNAFVGISRANTTNLAVVAPGIAEALLATAIGLVAAIPAVVIYNVFARSIAGYRAILADASAEILRHLSRDLDRRAADAGPAFPALQAAE